MIFANLKKKLLYMFCIKQDGLSVEEFETKLRTEARMCKLGNLAGALTCHALVDGVNDKILRDRQLSKACESEFS